MINYELDDCCCCGALYCSCPKVRMQHCSIKELYTLYPICTLRESLFTVSGKSYGKICFRDFMAALAGARVNSFVLSIIRLKIYELSTIFHREDNPSY